MSQREGGALGAAAISTGAPMVRTARPLIVFAISLLVLSLAFTVSPATARAAASTPLMAAVGASSGGLSGALASSPRPVEATPAPEQLATPADHAPADHAPADHAPADHATVPTVDVAPGPDVAVTDGYFAVTGAAIDGATDAAPALAEGEFVTAINATRVAHGLAPLSTNVELGGIARVWSAEMSASDRLRHNPDYSSQYTGEWTRIGENVGYTRSGGTDDVRVARMHQAFMDSVGHRANILGDYNQVGVGVAADAGTMWVTVNFVQGPVLAAVEPEVSPQQPEPSRQHFVRG